MFNYFPYFYYPAVPVPWVPAPILPPVDPQTQPQPRSVDPSSEEQQRYKRTWNTRSVEALSKACEEYCQQTGKAEESLSLLDFQRIAQQFTQTPEQCLTKFKEIRASGTLKPGAWCKDEEDLLVFLMNEGQAKWGELAKTINTQIHNGYSIRSGKQCKEKWNNYLNPSINRGPWTTEEDIAILEGHKKFGNKWSLIAKETPSRIESAVKNRIKSLINKEKQLLGVKSDETSMVDRVIQRIRSYKPDPAE